MRFAKTRWFIAALSLTASILAMRKALHLEGFAGAFHVIFSVVSLVASVLLIAPETALKIVDIVSRPIVDLIFPSERLAKPPLTYRLAHHYRDVGRYDDAIEQYRSIIGNYPDEKPAYLELIAMAKEAEDQETAQQIAAKYHKHFGEEAPNSMS